jgi:Tfp pilus assembly protein PilF
VGVAPASRGCHKCSDASATPVPLMRNVSIYLFLAAMTLAVYWPVRQFSFVNFDDDTYVYANKHERAGLTLANVGWAFRTYEAGLYHPVTLLSLLVDSSLFGMNPAGFHLENVFLHAINTLLLFGVLKSATGESGPAIFVALVFALHPAHVESVAWVSERKDVLSTTFMLLGMAVYLRYVRSGSRLSYLLMMGLYACGLLAKPMIVTFPFLLILLDYWPLRRGLSWVQEGMEKFPLLILSVISSIVTFAAEQQAGVIRGLQHIPMTMRLGNICVSYARYLGKSLWPAHLSAFYPFHKDWSLLVVGGSVGLIVGLTVLFVSMGRRRPYLVVGWLWFLGTLVPVIGIVQAGAQSMADRYLYAPVIGIAIMVAGAGNEAGRGFSRAAVALAAIVLIACGVVTRHQLEFWRDTRSLFQHALAVTGKNAEAHLQLGLFEASEGNSGSATAHYNEAIRLEPLNYVPQFDLANLLLKENPQEAVEHYEQAALENPGSARVQNNWGLALIDLHRPADAYAHFQAAERIDPNMPDAHANVGRVLLDSGFPDLARKEFAEALRLDPDFVEAKRGLMALSTTRP